MTVLEVKDLQVTLSGFSILRRVSLAVPAGGLIGLVGRNGAGKTTTLRAIMGLVPVAAGSVALNGADLRRVPSHGRAPLGIGYMPEDRRLIAALSVEDNILMPAWVSGRTDERARLETTYRIMPDLVPFARRRASALSGGQQKMVALARAVMTGTRLLLLDECFEGLSPAMGEKFAGAIRALQGEGIGILIAESDTRRLGFVPTLLNIERGEVS
jgi:branched-chain amino acid transport system ATP-binding protein